MIKFCWWEWKVCSNNCANDLEVLTLRQKNKSNIKTTKQYHPKPQTLTWKLIKLRVFIHTTCLLQGSCMVERVVVKLTWRKIGAWSMEHGEPTPPYGPSLLITFLAAIYEQYFQTRLVDCIFRTSCVCWWAQSQNQVILSIIPSSEPFRIGLLGCY